MIFIVMMIISFIRLYLRLRTKQVIQQQHHDIHLLILLQVVPESLLSALSEDSPTREAIGWEVFNGKIG